MVTDSTAVRDAPRIWRLLRARPRMEGADAVIDLTEEVDLAEDAADEAPAKRQKVSCSAEPGGALRLRSSPPDMMGFQPGETAPVATRDFLGPLLQSERSWYAPLVPDGSSWLWLVRGILPPGEETFQALWSRHPPELGKGRIFGREVSFKRHQQAFGANYAFTGQLSLAEPLTMEASPEVFMVKEAVRRWLRQAAEPLGRLNYGAVLVNWYDGGQHSIGAHSDHEHGLVAGSPILAVSWGCTRTFRVTPKPGCEQGSRAEVQVRDGDLVIMGGRCQQTHKHEVPKSARITGRRISLTFRAFKMLQGQPQAPPQAPPPPA